MKKNKKKIPSKDPWDVWIVMDKEDSDALCQLPDNNDREGVFALWNKCYAEVLAREQNGKVVRGWLFDCDPTQKRKAKK